MIFAVGVRVWLLLRREWNYVPHAKMSYQANLRSIVRAIYSAGELVSRHLSQKCRRHTIMCLFREQWLQSGCVRAWWDATAEKKLRRDFHSVTPQLLIIAICMHMYNIWSEHHHTSSGMISPQTAPLWCKSFSWIMCKSKCGEKLSTL